nr:retrovirus-related Pol polyprotein from transposon TNT 1-94 [Tanacetum cinerariifolium]
EPGPSDLAPQRQTRERRLPKHLEDYVVGADLDLESEEAHVIEEINQDLVYFEEVIKIDKWKKAMDAEIKAIEKNNTWHLIDLPKDAKCIGVKWVYKTKLNENGEVEKYKARLVAKGTYALKMLERFGMLECNSVKNPMVPGTKLKNDDGEKVDSTLFKQIVGSLMYITNTRPDLQFVRWKGELKVYADSDYAGDLNDRKSTTGYVVLWDGAAITWASRKQSIVALYSTEEFGSDTSEATKIQCDNTSAIKLSKNLVFHGKCKHIEVRYHFLRDLVNNGTMELEFCGTKDQLADALTKPLERDVFIKIREQLGVRFRVCPLTLDPKIIMIPHCNKKDLTFHLSRVEVKVFCLSSCAWRRPSINLPRENMTLETPQMDDQEIMGRYLTGTDEYVSGSGRKSTVDQSSYTIGYRKMKSLVINIKNEIVIDIEMHDKQVLPALDQFLLQLEEELLSKKTS